MNYIGSKYSLMDFLKQSIRETLAECNEHRPPSEMVFADLFAGTGIVSNTFADEGYSLITNDIQYYSYAVIRHAIGNRGMLNEKRCAQFIEKLNQIEGVAGFIYKNYSYGGTEWQKFRRMYFSDHNAKKCDAMRMEIEHWRKEGVVSESEYFFLLASLICSIDKYANTASVYGAYLKKLKRSASKEMRLVALPISKNRTTCNIYNEDALALIKKVSGDILYLDPPYNARQYCTNYHLLETIAKYDNPIIKGKTGLREYARQKSTFCNKTNVVEAFEELIKNAKFKYVFLSYNNEGLMTLDTIGKTMRRYGEYRVYTREYRRFKADNARRSETTLTTEYVHCIEK